MTCVYKEYEGKIKMVQEQWVQLKMKVLLRYNMKNVVSGGNEPWWGESTGGRGAFPGGGDGWVNFWPVGEPHPPNKENSAVPIQKCKKF